MRTYDTYKDSRIAWLGQIPSHWEVRRAKVLFKKEKRPVSPLDEVVTCFRDGQVTLRKNRRVKGFTESILEIGYQGIKKGDLVIHQMDAFAGSSGVSDSDGKGTPVYHVCSAKLDTINNYYYAHILRRMGHNGYIQSLYRGIRERSSDFRFDVFARQYLPVPPIEEQNAIVNYLTNATAKIDEAIAQQQKMIDLLKERKQIIINEAVTHGLDPNVPMKQTGIDWLPQIPAHWHIRRMASLGTFSKGSGISRDDLTEEGLPAILYGDIYTKYEISVSNLLNHISEKTAANAVKINAGDILLTGSGETKEDIGKAILYNGELAYAGGDVIIFRQQRMDGLFLSYVLNSFYARYYKAALSKGEIVVHTYPYLLKNLAIPIPSISEQKSIALYLDEKCQTINLAIQRHERMISLLTERKQIVINDVVTGKIKVK